MEIESHACPELLQKFNLPVWADAYIRPQESAETSIHFVGAIHESPHICQNHRLFDRPNNISSVIFPITPALDSLFSHLDFYPPT